MALVAEALQRHPLRCWTSLDHNHAPIAGLAAIAANARAVQPTSVTHKPESSFGLPARSYVNAVPHWQSISASEGALQRHGLLGLGGPPCGDVAQQLDRARLQLMIDCVCSLALDAHLNSNQASAGHAALLVRTWFLDPATAMIPDGAYARLSSVEPDRNLLDAALDFRDLYPLIDALTLLQRQGCFSLAEQQQIEEWFDAFLSWLAAGSTPFLSQHNASPACTWYHLLMLAIAAFRGRRNVAAQVFDNLPGLLASQFRPDGSPRSANAESLLHHEQLFNLQAWCNLAVLSSALGRDLLTFAESHGIGLRAVLAHACGHLPDQPSPESSLSASLWLQAMQAMALPDPPAEPADVAPLAEASSGLPPFWSLCRPLALG